MSKPYLITGRKNTGGVFPRLPIETLQSTQPEQFTLFILAFLFIQDRQSAFMEVIDFGSLAPGASWTNPTPDRPGIRRLPSTFLQIGGIHGLPYEEYPGDPRPETDRASDFSTNDKKDTHPVPSRFGGYCNHGAVFFPTWHRPYVLLIEQAIGEAADGIAAALEKNNLNQGGKWIKAAKELRFPYWDWAEADVANKGLPVVLHTDKVTITLPGGTKKEVDNPLSYYPFEGGKIPTGFRDVPDPRKLKEHGPCVRKKVGRLFTFDGTGDPALVWDEFSNHTTESLRKKDYRNAGSLEGVHDSMHIIIGGNGHMGDPDYAGFDPIFYLHHANVDRLLALWEYCYRDYWMGVGYTNKGKLYPWTQSRGTYFQVYNEQLLPDSPLAPFRGGDGGYWTSNQTRFLNETAFPKYYTYPEIAGIKVDQPATPEQRVKARAALQKYYGFEPRETSLKLHATAPALFQTDVPVPAQRTAVKNYRSFVIVVKLPEHAFNRPYSFNLYKTALSNEGSEGDEIIGSVSVFARPDHSPCKGCALRRDAGSIIRGIIPIPPTLVDRIIESKEGLNVQEVNEQELTEEIKKGFAGVIIDSKGVELAQARAGGGLAMIPEHDTVPHHIAPQKIVLLSAAAAHPEDDPEGPVSLFDWKHHGDIFTSGWEKSDNFPE
ncbi:hypothetical protein JAAARDRAFT_197528 [Jaapia argillacea MUCL 33604]|uniref:tyrosinase n=1 Tax=Jaapia argillacea MUCL 33604 TaxID=933084 RepID=A0A067PSS3_9AGAM|nr:hypothetical protein JAAARDRAFT_197528 [Jaapia argillacea MUCL 33604]